MHRREFLRRAGLSLGAVSATAAATAAKSLPAHRARPFQPDDWTSVREQFALSPNLIHMATFYFASHPRPVADAIERHRRALDLNPVEAMHEQMGEGEERQRRTAAEYMGGTADQIALTDSTTMGLGLIYGGLRLEAGDEVLTTTHDHYSTHMSLEHRAERTGAAIRKVALYDDSALASVDEIVTRLRNAIDDATRVIAVTWVHSSTGVKLPISAIAKMIADINRARGENDRILLCVDGVHGFGVEDATMEDLGCDFFIAGTHKWIFGPRGTGVIWGATEAWKRAQPVIPSFGPNYGVWLGYFDADQVPAANQMTPGGFHSFEHRWALEEAFRFHVRIGKARVQTRIHQLNTLMKDGLAAMPHVRLRTPRTPELSSGIICFEVEGVGPEAVVERLRTRDIIASTTPYREQYARLAPSLINNEDEVERTLAAVAELA